MILKSFKWLFKKLHPRYVALSSRLIKKSFRCRLLFPLLTVRPPLPPTHLKFGSVESFLEAIGLSDMPQAQLYGILFGCIVFILTVSTVLALLFFGGSFQRIVEQSQPDAATANMSAEETRMNRALLLERLLDSRQYLFQRNYNEEDGKVDTSNKKNGCYKAEIGYYTNLTKMLLNVKPPSKDGKEEEQSKANLDTERLEEIETYKQNYVIAYRKCQDKPGGK